MPQVGYLDHPLTGRLLGAACGRHVHEACSE
jgi:hypothetical protein